MLQVGIDYLAGEPRINVGPFVSRKVSQARDLIAPAHVVPREGSVGTVAFDPVLRFPGPATQLPRGNRWFVIA
jgi:hypothetical protein